MNFDDETEITGEKAQAANDACKAVMQALIPYIAKMECAGEKATLLAGAAIPTLGGLAALFSDPASYQKVAAPGPEELMFGACYIIATSESHSQGLIMGYSADTILKAIEIFEKLTGRKYTNIHPMLRHILDEHLADGKDVPEGIKKFIS